MRALGVLIVLTGFARCMLVCGLVRAVFTEYVSVCMCSWLYAQLSRRSSLIRSM
jgi:hypothetical protein